MSATNIWTQGNREHGAEMYIKALEIPLKQIVTIGDMSSDVLMFQNSGVSIAMGNASADVQREATFVTTSNEEEGFANTMERFVFWQQERLRSCSAKSKRR